MDTNTNNEMAAEETAEQTEQVQTTIATENVDESSIAAANAEASTDEKVVNGDSVPHTNGETVQNGENGQEQSEILSADQFKAEAETKAKTVDGILTKIKSDPNMTDADKMETLCALLQKIIQDNHILKADMTMMSEQMTKSNQAKDAVKQLNVAYKKQIDLVREENELRLKEEQAKRIEVVNGYQNTMSDLSDLLETHTGQNVRLRDENTGMAEKLTILVQETAKREKQMEGRTTEYQLQIQLLEHQVQKANIEKAEIKADMTQEKLETMKELSLERERNSNLEDTVKLLKEQASIYQAQMEELSSGAGNNTKKFNHFKTQIDKLTKQMTELDRDTHQWREKYETSAQQVKKMNVQSLEREKEVGQLKKKLDSMVKLNKTLSEERNKLTNRIQELEK